MVETQPLLLGINLDVVLATALQKEASTWELQVEIVRNQTIAEEFLKQNKYGLVLV